MLFLNFVTLNKNSTWWKISKAIFCALLYDEINICRKKAWRYMVFRDKYDSFLLILSSFLFVFLHLQKILKIKVSKFYLLTSDTIYHMVKELLIRLHFFLTKISKIFVDISTSIFYHWIFMHLNVYLSRLKWANIQKFLSDIHSFA